MKYIQESGPTGIKSGLLYPQLSSGRVMNAWFNSITQGQKVKNLFLEKYLLIGVCG